MEYFVIHVVDWRDRHENWALIDKECMPEREDGRVCKEHDVKAVASSRAEFELKMTAMGLKLLRIDNSYQMASTETWTAWSVGKVEDDG